MMGNKELQKEEKMKAGTVSSVHLSVLHVPYRIICHKSKKELLLIVTKLQYHGFLVSVSTVHVYSTVTKGFSFCCNTSLADCAQNIHV